MEIRKLQTPSPIGALLKRKPSARPVDTETVKAAIALLGPQDERLARLALERMQRGES